MPATIIRQRGQEVRLTDPSPGLVKDIALTMFNNNDRPVVVKVCDRGNYTTVASVTDGYYTEVK